MTERGIDKLKAGDFNDLSQEELPGGWIQITLRKRGEDRLYRFQVRDLYGPGEDIRNENVEEVH